MRNQSNFNVSIRECLTEAHTSLIIIATYVLVSISHKYPP